MSALDMHHTGDETALNLMDEAHDLERDEHFLAPLDGDSPAAITALQILPTGTQEQIRKLLRSSEQLRFVEKPSRWRCASHWTLFFRHSSIYVTIGPM